MARKMTEFDRLLRYVSKRLEAETEIMRKYWWWGYQQGVLRAGHLRWSQWIRYGSDEGHQCKLDYAKSDNPDHRAIGRGYIAGLTLEKREPDASLR